VSVTTSRSHGLRRHALRLHRRGLPPAEASQPSSARSSAIRNLARQHHSRSTRHRTQARQERSTVSALDARNLPLLPCPLCSAPNLALELTRYGRRLWPLHFLGYSPFRGQSRPPTRSAQLYVRPHWTHLLDTPAQNSGTANPKVGRVPEFSRKGCSRGRALIFDFRASV
jgi:hypothetical protein